MGLGILAIVAIVTVVAIAVFTIAVAAIAITTVLTIATIAIVIAVLTTRHVDTVEHHTWIWHLLFLGQSIQQTEGRLRCVVGTTYIDSDVSLLTNREGVGNESYRGCIEDDIVVTLTKHVDNLLEVVTGQELSGVRRNRTGKQQVEVRVVDTLLDL